MEKGDSIKNAVLDIEEEEKCLGEQSADKEDLEFMEKGGKNDSDSSSQITEQKGNAFTRCTLAAMDRASDILQKNQVLIAHVGVGLLISSYLAYFIAAMLYDLSFATPLIILTVVVLLILLWEAVSPRLSSCIKSMFAKNCGGKSKFLKKIFFWIQVVCAIVFASWLLISIIARDPRQLVSLVGLGLIVFVCFIFSKYPEEVSWRPVLWGIAMQFILGLLILRTNAGFVTVSFVGKQVATFMNYSDVGSIFVFSKTYKMHFFAFKVLPMIVFFSTVMNMLYYVGLMQWFIGKLSYVTQKTLGTSAIESTVAVANIFVGMTEAPLVVRPYLEELTNAEIHSVLTTGLGSIAFSVYGAFVAFGVDEFHLLTACVMSAPASLAISRLLYPERKKSKFMTTDSLKLTEGTNRNIIEAAAAGASMSIGLVANIAANLIAFLALLAFVNQCLSWFGSFVGFDELSFELICSYLFMPLAFLMGADWEDCGLVGRLFGIKTFLNEFVAYTAMKPYILHRENQDVPKIVNGTVNYMSMRSEVVAIHALCGFCNVSSLGIIVGGLGSIMPAKKEVLADLALRALIGGMLTCCMTACIASLLFIEPTREVVMAGNISTVPLLGDITTIGTLAGAITANGTS